MRLHDDWSAVTFDRPPAAELVGPFVGRPFLETLWEHRGGEVLFAESATALLAMVRAGSVVTLLGEADLTDYHAPLGDGAAELAHDLAGELEPGTRLVWDSLPSSAADPLATGLAKAGLTVESGVHEIAAVLDLPDDPDDYLERIGSKQRHEVRRKARRFEEAFGAPVLATRTDADALAAFVAMHRAAPGEKGGFMTPGMERLFGTLLDRVPGARLDVLSGDDGVPRAAAFGFDDGRAYYLYNSAFAPDAGAASPGIVLVHGLIAGAITAGLERFDFLKGDETYKFRLGAVARPLIRLEATT